MQTKQDLRKLIEELFTRLQRRATQVDAPSRHAKLASGWRCSLCENLFWTFPHKSKSTDGQKPVCCPYCGQIFENFTEYP